MILYSMYYAISRRFTRWSKKDLFSSHALVRNSDVVRILNNGMYFQNVFKYEFALIYTYNEHGKRINSILELVNSRTFWISLLCWRLLRINLTIDYNHSRHIIHHLMFSEINKKALNEVCNELMILSNYNCNTFVFLEYRYSKIANRTYSPEHVPMLYRPALGMHTALGTITPIHKFSIILSSFRISIFVTNLANCM